MLKELKFVQGAVAKKDFVPAMTHFAIEKGEVRSFNGIVACSSPIPFDIDCKPKAVPLVKAIANCEETVVLHMSPAGRLAIRSGPFKAFIECIHEDTPHVKPEGKFVNLNGADVVEGFRLLEPFIGTDASRQWGTGVLLRGQSAFATNNVTLVEYWMGTPFPYVVNVPRAAIAEILRVAEPCVGLQMSERSMTFHFADKKWIRTALLTVEWPNLDPILDKVANYKPVPQELFTALAALAPFCDKHGRIYIKDDVARTAPPEAPEEGASFDIPGFGYEGIYRREMLQRLEGVATVADLSYYPEPCLFQGERLRGAIIGMRGS